jgi:phospholipid/cholesterol/gamma-HCH transport system substrate-binding protein
MQQSKVVETWVGLFVALGVIGLFFLAMKVSNLADLQASDKSYTISARFQNVGSLRSRAQVSMSGVRVGRVSAIRFDKETYEAIVEMRIEPEYDTLPNDTTASILTAGLLGEQYIGLSPGGADEYLKDGDEIELTQSAMVLEEVISRFLFNKAESGGEKKDAQEGGHGGAEKELEDGAGASAPEDEAAEQAEKNASPSEAKAAQPHREAAPAHAAPKTAPESTAKPSAHPAPASKRPAHAAPSAHETVKSEGRAKAPASEKTPNPAKATGAGKTAAEADKAQAAHPRKEAPK